jgi:hypothetical protein
MKTIYYVDPSNLEKGIQESSQYEIIPFDQTGDDGTTEKIQELWVNNPDGSSDPIPYGACWFFYREEAVAFAESIRADRIAKLQALEF